MKFIFCFLSLMSVAFAQTDFNKTEIIFDTPTVVKPTLLLKNIEQIQDKVRVSWVQMSINGQPPRDIDHVYLHPAFEKQVLDLLCARIGAGKSLGRTYVNVVSQIADYELYLAPDANFSFGIDIKKLLTPEQQQQRLEILNGFLCEKK